MAHVTEEFFDQLSRRGRERLTPKTTGTIRFDLEHEHGVERWLVTITNGEVEVSREECEADTVIRTGRAFFERMARGEAKPLSAWLRNDITSEGQFRFIVLLERLFPEPAGARHPKATRRLNKGPG